MSPDSTTVSDFQDIHLDLDFSISIKHQTKTMSADRAAEHCMRLAAFVQHFLASKKESSSNLF
jgi:hypothetical protein